jgi:hypothetical protein
MIRIPKLTLDDFSKEKTLSLAKMMVDKKGHIAFKEIRAITKMKGRDVANIITSLWSNTLESIRNKDENLIKEIIPANTCISCVGCCGKKREMVANIWNNSVMSFNGIECDKRKDREEFSVKMQTISIQTNGEKAKTITFAMDTNGILRMTSGNKYELGKYSEKMMLLPENVIRKHIFSMLEHGAEISQVYPNKDDFRVKNMDIAPGEKFSAYINRVHDMVRQARRSKMETIDSMTEQQLQDALKTKILSSKIGEVLRAFGEDFSEFLAVYFPDKTIKEIYKEMAR